MNRIVITGAPGTGKTTLIESIITKGHYCFPEVSRTIIQWYQEQGIPQLFLSDPEKFSDIVLDGRIEDYHKPSISSDKTYFYDRGAHDVIAYMQFKGEHIPQRYVESCSKSIYDQVLILPPWQEIYTSDNERYESYEEALSIHDHLVQTYQEFGYDAVIVPIGTVESRLEFIFDQINLL